MDKILIKDKKSGIEKIDIHLTYFEYLEGDKEIGRKDINFLSRSGLYLNSNEPFRGGNYHSGKQCTISDIGILQYKVVDNKKMWYVYSYPELENDSSKLLCNQLKKYKIKMLDFAKNIPISL